MIDLQRAKLRCMPMGAALRFGGSSKSSSSNSTTTTTTDNRQVSGEAGVNIGAGAHYTGTDGGSVKIAEFNRQLMGEVVRSQTDATKFLTDAGARVLDNLGGSVTDALAKSGANSAQAWSHTIDASESIIGSLTASARANADAGQVIATAALNANKNDSSAASDIFKYGAIAAAVIGGLWALGRKG